MSFSKAKLTRFNDVISDTPAPGSYNPNLDKRVRSCTPTSERGDLNKSPTGSVHSEKSSITSTPCFRTPRLPARRKLICSQSARKYTVKEQQPNNDAPHQLLDQQREELQEKIVECMNKTQCIKDLEFQIDELKEQISTLMKNNTNSTIDEESSNRIIEENKILISSLKTEKKILLEEIDKIHNDYRDEITRLDSVATDTTVKLNDMKLLLEEAIEEKDTLNFENEEHRIELYELRQSNEELMIDNYELYIKVKNKSILQKKLLTHQKRVQLLVQKLKTKQKNIRFLQKRIMSIRKELCDLKTETHSEISNLQQQLITAEAAKNKEREEMEFGFLEVIQQLRSTNNEMVNNHKKEIAQYKENTHKHIRQIQENTNTQIHDLQVLLDENVRKHDMETKNLKLVLSDTERDLQYAIEGKQKLNIELGQKKCVINELQRKLSSTIIELNDVRENWSKELSGLLLQIDNLNNQKRRYTIALDETRSTVQVITDRLVESDEGVEQLKQELEKLEQFKIQIESENNDLKMKTKHLEEINADLNENKLVQIEQIREEIDNEKQILINTVEDYKQIVINTIKDCEEKQQTLISNTNEMQIKYSVLEENYNVLENTTSKKIQQLEKQCEKHLNNNKELLEQLKAREQKFLEAQSLISASKIEMEHQDAEITDLKFKVHRLESQIVSLQVPADKMKMDKLFEENKKLKDQVKHVEESSKYLELMEKFKQLNVQVNKDKKNRQDMESKIRTQNKLIEKLKQEVTSPKSSRRGKLLVSNEKENQSPGKAAVIRTESPNTTPLKDRNIRQ